MFASVWHLHHRPRAASCNFRKFKMADGRHFALSPYLSRELSDFDQIWYTDTNFHSEHAHLTKNRNFSNSRWRTDAILKIVFLAIFRRYIGRSTRNLEQRWRITWRYRSRDQICNFRKFKMADRRHFENSIIFISQPRMIRFRSNLVGRCRLQFPWWSFNKQEAQLMLTTGSTRLAVSRGQQTWYHSTCYI